MRRSFWIVFLDALGSMLTLYPERMPVNKMKIYPNDLRAHFAAVWGYLNKAVEKCHGR